MHTLVNKSVPWFVASVSIILITTGILKLEASTAAASSSAAIAYLDRADDVIGFLSTRRLLMLAGILELVVVTVIVWRRKHLDETLSLIVWTGSIFLAYRIARWWLGAAGVPCGCLGLLARQDAELFSKIALAWMLCGGCVLLVLHHFGSTTSEPLDTESQ